MICYYVPDWVCLMFSCDYIQIMCFGQECCISGVVTSLICQNRRPLILTYPVSLRFSLMTCVRWFLQVSPRWSYSFSLCNKLTCGEIFWDHVNVRSVFSLLCKASPCWEVRATGSEGTLVEGALASFWSGDNTESHLYSANYVPGPVSALHMLTYFSHQPHEVGTQIIRFCTWGNWATETV